MHRDDASLDILKPVFLGTFAIASDQVCHAAVMCNCMYRMCPIVQASKLGLGKNSSILSLFQGHQVSDRQTDRQTDRQIDRQTDNKSIIMGLTTLLGIIALTCTYYSLVPRPYKIGPGTHSLLMR